MELEGKGFAKVYDCGLKWVRVVNLTIDMVQGTELSV